MVSSIILVIATQERVSTLLTTLVIYLLVSVKETCSIGKAVVFHLFVAVLCLGEG
jgi:hypothetical protein